MKWGMRMILIVALHFTVSVILTWFTVNASYFITDVFRNDASSLAPGAITVYEQMFLFISSIVGMLIVFFIINLLTSVVLRLFQENEIYKKIKRYVYLSHSFLFVISLVLICNHIFNYSAI